MDADNPLTPTSESHIPDPDGSAQDTAPITIQVDPLDIAGMTEEERIQLAIVAIQRNGFRDNGDPLLSFRSAAKEYGVPRSTLQARFHGRQTRKDAHVKEMRLTPAQEDALAEWIKEKGRRNVPLHYSAVAEHARAVSGQDIGEAWVRKFRARREDLKNKWATGQEKCRAGALNEPITMHFYDTLSDLVTRYNIKPENMYNMDEKGVQLGKGQRTKVLVDRGQRDVQTLEDGDRELVTILECICADGTAIRPNVVFQGKRRDMEWGRVNPCDASISHSPKGWTDQELGSQWLERDFEPATRVKLKDSNEYRLLILDGHNSHTTYRFCSFAKRNKIVILCLPPHTTHALQPADVGVFGPLSSTWGTEVNEASSNLVPIRKHNFLAHYARARAKAFTEKTICSAWRKTGIWPFNRDAIPKRTYAPALNTTEKAAQPIGAVLPTLLTPLESTASSVLPIPTAPEPLSSTGSPPCTGATPLPVSTSLSVSTPHSSFTTTASREATPALSSASETLSHASTASHSSTSSIIPEGDALRTLFADQVYTITGLPPRCDRSATKDKLIAENQALRSILDQCCYQMQRDYAVKKLMDQENERLRQQLFGKENRPKKKQTNAYARHMTSDENMALLAKEDWKGLLKEMFENEKFRLQKAAVEAECKRLDSERVEREKESKRREKEEEKRAKDAEKARKKQEEDEEKARKKAEKKAEADRKKADAVLLKKAEQAARKAEASRKKTRISQKRAEAEHEEVEEDNAEGEQETEDAHLIQPRQDLLTPSRQQNELPQALAVPTSPSKRIRPRPVQRRPPNLGPVDIDSQFIICRRSSRLAGHPEAN